jgi:hypothetical protein
LTGQCQGALVALPLDVTREDLLHEAVDIIRAHLPAGEDGECDYRRIAEIEALMVT